MEYLSPKEQTELKALRLAEPSADETLRQLDRIFASEKFERVQRKAKDFLGFIVSKKLLGLADQIKETTIAVSVYGEPAEYDPAENNKVRMAALDLRARLAEYDAGEGQRDPVAILIPAGTYVPEIRERRPVIAVSLFQNWNLDGVQAHLCGTVSAEIADQLTHTGAVRASRVATLEGVDHNSGYGLRGSLECRANVLRLNASLSDLYTRQIICCHAFEGSRDDIFKLSRQVAEAVVKRIQPEGDNHAGAAIQAPRERFESLQLYQQGRWHLRRRTAADIRQAIELFEQAIEANREYARAYSGLADCHLILSWYALSPPDRVWFEVAKAHALTALGLHPGLPEAHTSLAYAKLLCDFDWAGAEEEFRRAIRIQNRYAPAHHWYANLLVMQGRFAEAQAEIKRASDLDRGCIVIRKTVGDPYYYSRNYQQAIECYRAALAMDPNFWMAHLFLGWAYEQMGDTTRALQEFEIVAAGAGLSSIVQGAIGHFYATSGREPEARAIIHRLQEQPGALYVAPHTLAVIYAGLGENDRAFEWLEASYENRIELLGWIKVDPRFDVLRDDPRFDRFLERIGLKALPSDAAYEI
jgi:tetratricopeptide (TPR) repeat protein